MDIKYVMLLAAGMVLTFSSCEQKKKSANVVVEAVSDSDSIQKADGPKLESNEELNDAARFVAGMPIENKKSKLYELTQTEEWKKHSKNMDQIWNSFLQSAPKVMAFSQNELGTINSEYKTIFYPFGGPDYLFPNTFFPDMDTYFLIGLERAGNPIKVKHPSVATYRLYQNAVSDILNLSFFRTIDMKQEVTKTWIQVDEYILHCLVQGNIKKEKSKLEEAKKMLTEFRDAWYQGMKQLRQKQAVGK